MSDIAEIQGADIPLELVPVDDSRAAMGMRPSAHDETGQYMGGFSGAAIQPFSPEAAKVFAAPIPPHLVEVKPDGIVYLPWVFYQQRLNQAFGPGGHALMPRSPARKMDETIIYHGALFALGRFVSEAVGECEHRNGMTYAASLEGARSDCRTRCCKDLGIAMELWDPSWREKWLAEWALKAWTEYKGKGKWYYWRKDRERPWQVENLAAQPGRADAGAPHEAPGDTGEAPMDDDMKDFIGLLDGVKWAKPKVKAWLEKYFGCTPDEFTKVQMKAACNMLLAWNKDPRGAYQETVAELQKLGVIKGPAVGPEAPI